MTSRLRELAGLMETLARRPREFPSALLELIKHFVRNIWNVRGGGLYACGFMVALAWLEIKMLVQDVMSFSGFGDFFNGQLIQFILRFTFESMANTLQAFLWPVAIVEIYPPWGVIALIAMYIIFPKVIKSPLERWLSGGER